MDTIVTCSRALGGYGQRPTYALSFPGSAIALGYPFGIADWRHILLGIAQHYDLDVFQTVRGRVTHFQAGRSHGLGARHYARTQNIHPSLTNELILDTKDFCDRWAALLGFSGAQPKPMSGEEM